MPKVPLSEIDLSKPRYGDHTYSARLRHFLEITSPFNTLASTRQLAEAATLVKAHKEGTIPPGTTEGQLWKAKRLYDSAYHPDTGEKMLLYGRMSFQVPGNMVITGLMITFNKHPLAVTFWQSANQAFNAITNYTNRSGDKDIPPSHAVKLGLVAIAVATTTALGFGEIAKIFKHPGPVLRTCGTFVGVAFANMVNLPLMRLEELKTGIQVTDIDGNKLGDEVSKTVATRGVIQSVTARIASASVIIFVPGLLMEYFVKNRMPFVAKNRVIEATLTVILTGLSVWVGVPVGQALFPQTSRVSISKLEPKVKESIQRVSPDTEHVYYNRGL